MEKVVAEKTAKPKSNKEADKILLQMYTLLEFTRKRISTKDNIRSITVRNETHTLTITENEK